MPQTQNISISKVEEKEIPPEIEFEQFMERLRTRFNVLNTSVFLLEDNLKSSSGNKTFQYIHKINMELQRIRALINQASDNPKP